MKLVQIVPPTLVEYSLQKATSILGRDEDVDIKIEGDGIFAKHAAIWENRGLFAISDWAKQGNLWVNGKEVISGQALRANDEIKLGESVLKFVPDHFYSEPNTPRALLDPVISPSEKLNHISAETRAQLRRISLCPPEKTQLWQKRYFRRMKNLQKLGNRVFSLKSGKLVKSLKRDAMVQPIDRCHQFWRDYTQTAFQSSTAYHIIENTSFRQTFSADISNVDFATAWISQIISVLFEHQHFLENEWIEYTLLQLIDEAVADSVIARHVFDKLGRMVSENSAEFIATRDTILQESQEEIDLEILQNKQVLGVDEIKKRWMKTCPYTRPLQHQHKKYTAYRREVFLEFLKTESIRLPRQIGIYIWGKYYEYEARKLAQFKRDKNILTNLSFENGVMRKKNAPLWKAKIGFSFGGQQYLIDVAHRDERGRLLAFVPGKPDDLGEALVLIESENETIIDQQGRAIHVGSDGLLMIESKSGITRKKQLRPTPNSIIKTIISAIIHESKILSVRKKATKSALAKLDDIPIIVNWDTLSTRRPLLNVVASETQRNMPIISFYKTPRAMLCAVHPMFFSPLSGALFFQYLNFEVTSSYRTLLKRNISVQNNANITLQRLALIADTRKNNEVISELSAEASGIHQSVLIAAIKKLAKQKIVTSNTDLMLIYLTIAHQQYQMGMAVQRNMAKLRLSEDGVLVDAIEKMWHKARLKSNTVIWMQDTLCGTLDGIVYPLLFENLNVDFSAIYDDFSRNIMKHGKIAEKTKKDFLEKLRQSLTYSAMLKGIVRQAQHPSSAMLSVLATFSDDEKTMTRLPKKIGGTATMQPAHELFSMVGDIVPLQYTSRIMHAREDNVLRPLAWSVVAQSSGDYTLILRDSRQPILDLANAGYPKEARQITQDTLDAFVSGFNHFMERLVQI